MDRFVWTVIGVALFGVMVLLMANVALSSGPNCPNMDPSWIGYCK